MGDPFGNYLTQKLIDVSTDDKLLQIIIRVENTIVDLCIGMHGTRSVQKLVEVVSHRPLGHRQLLARFLSDNVATLSHEINGNHVLVKVLQHWSYKDKDFIY